MLDKWIVGLTEAFAINLHGVQTLRPAVLSIIRIAIKS